MRISWVLRGIFPTFVGGAAMASSLGSGNLAAAALFLPVAGVGLLLIVLGLKD